MSFTGNLEHLPIIDIVQLLHQTRKTGTLALKSHKGESYLVFKDGYIVSANHHNNSIRIGRILVDMGAVSEEVIEKALREQGDSEEKKPLIALLLENGLIAKETAFKGLEALIELTIVEVLTWNEGTFTLDISTDVVSDEYRYFPEKLNEELILDTQNVLMDALRIYDERNRDGALVEEDWLSDDSFSLGEPESSPGVSDDGVLSLEDLGLDALDSFERKIPEVFTGIKDEDPAEVHRRLVRNQLGDAPAGQQDRVTEYLLDLHKEPAVGGLPPNASPARTVILFSGDKLLRHLFIGVGKQDNLVIFTTDDPEDLLMIINQSVSKNRGPLLIMDRQAEGTGIPESIAGRRQEILRDYPAMDVIQFVDGTDIPLWIESLRIGARAVFPKPSADDHAGYAAQIVPLIEGVRGYIRGCRHGNESQQLAMLNGYVKEMRSLTKASDIALVLLKLAGSLFDRALVLVVNGNELVAERSIGIKGDRSHGPSMPLRFSLTLSAPSQCRDVVESGQRFWGSHDAFLKERLFAEIAAPFTPNVLLLPLKCFGRTIALIYADFGKGPAYPVDVSLIECAAQTGSLILDNALYKSKVEKK